TCAQQADRDTYSASVVDSTIQSCFFKDQMVEGNGENQFRQYAGQNAGNPAGYNDVIGNQVIQNAVQNPRGQNGNAAGKNGNQIRCYNSRGVGHYARNYTVRPRRRDVAYLQTQLLIAQKEEAGIQP
nr:hypothetical protein [Tanacetum cinerariifolium]